MAGRFRVGSEGNREGTRLDLDAFQVGALGQ